MSLPICKKPENIKTLRSLILATSKLKPKKALETVLEQNPIGLSEENTKKMILMAAQALKLLGKRPQQIGMVLGALVAAGLGGAYFAIAPR